MKHFITLAFFLLGGCAATSQAVVTEAVSTVKAADDNLVTNLRTAVCALPLSAILRNPDIIPGVKALCVPSGASDPAVLLKATP